MTPAEAYRARSCGSTWTREEIAAMQQVLAFAARNGFAQTFAIQTLSEKLARMAAKIDARSHVDGR